VDRTRRRKRHSGGGCKRRYSTFGRIHRVFYAQLRILALQRGYATERAADSRVELQNE
jgi:hypothetical protein